MEVVVDGSTGFVSPESGTTLKSFLGILRENLKGMKRVVVELTLDGEGLTSERESTVGGKAVSDYGLLEVRTANPFKVSLDTLSGLITHLTNLERAHDEGLSCADAGTFSKALEKFEACFSGWDILVRVVRDVGNLSSVDFQALKSGELTIEDRFQALHESLLKFAGAMDLKDIARISELAKDELKPRVEEWREVVQILCRHVATMAGAA